MTAVRRHDRWFMPLWIDEGYSALGYARNCFGVSDRRARGTVVPNGPDSFLLSEMNAQAEG